MRGPTILARTMSAPTTRASGKKAWQYHSRSDSHSKVACWTLLFDLLIECAPMRQAAEAGRLGFGINYEMVGPINKRLDLVLTINQPGFGEPGRRTFAALRGDYGVLLDDDESAMLAALPKVWQDISKNGASEIAIAMEAKACMTEHVKSLPRLHAEILATGYLARLAAPHCILVSYTLINAATNFISPSSDGKINHHSQPDDVRRVVEMIRDAVPMASKVAAFGYDVVGTTVMDCRNDGSPISLVNDTDLAPKVNDRLNYDQMVKGICSAFRARFRE